MGRYYVYRYMYGNQWIYVGQADASNAKNELDCRIRCHSKEEKFAPWLNKCRIEYCVFDHHSDMHHAEAALIKIKKPKLNVALKNESSFPFIVNEKKMQWIQYKTKEQIRKEDREAKERDKKEKKIRSQKHYEKKEKKNFAYHMKSFFTALEIIADCILNKSKKT